MYSMLVITDTLTSLRIGVLRGGGWTRLHVKDFALLTCALELWSSSSLMVFSSIQSLIRGTGTGNLYPASTLGSDQTATHASRGNFRYHTIATFS